MLENNGDLSFQNYTESCKVAMATYMRTDWWNGYFLKRNIPERKAVKQKLQTSSSFEEII